MKNPKKEVFHSCHTSHTLHANKMSTLPAKPTVVYPVPCEDKMELEVETVRIKFVQGKKLEQGCCCATRIVRIKKLQNIFNLTKKVK